MFAWPRTARLVLVFLLLLWLRPQLSPAAASKYRLIFQNQYVEVFDLELDRDRQAPIHDNLYDVLWIALDGANLELQGVDGTRELELGAGDLRIFQKHAMKSLLNKTGGTIHAVVIYLRHGSGFANCGCLSEVERAICGCSDAGHLPDIWALAGSEFTLSQATLQPGDALREISERDDTLLVALRPLDLKHEVNAGQREEWAPSASTLIHLDTGEVEWLQKGKHHLTNESNKPARFISIEF